MCRALLLNSQFCCFVADPVPPDAIILCVQMAAVALVSAPLFLVFIFLRKYIMAGVSRSGIKG